MMADAAVHEAAGEGPGGAAAAETGFSKPAGAGAAAHRPGGRDCPQGHCSTDTEQGHADGCQLAFGVQCQTSPGDC